MTTPKQFSAPTTYFLQEGRENLRECFKTAFHAAKTQNISKIVIFTASGDGVRLAIDEFLPQDEFKQIKLIAVTFPPGRFKNSDGTDAVVDISAVDRQTFNKLDIPVIRAHLPFDSIESLYPHSESPARDLSLVGETLNWFCGSMSLCVQGILMACDAGVVSLGEHVIALTSDTAILAQATTTRRAFRELVIREVLCKPVVLSISRKEIADKSPVQMKLLAGTEPGPTDAIDSSSAPSKTEGSPAGEGQT